MNIVLYKCSAEHNRLDKSSHLVYIRTLSGVLRDEVSITEPTIEIEFNGTLNFNYAYIPEFNRYYSIFNYDIVSNNICRLYLNIDVLMSYKNSILNLRCFVSRNEFSIDWNIIDDKRVYSAGTNTIVDRINNDDMNIDIDDNGKIVPCVVISGIGLGITEKT